MRRLLALAVTALVLSGCPLRPRYADFVKPDTLAKSVEIQVVADGVPVPGARIEMGDSRNKLVATTDAEGFFTLPVTKQYLDDNPVLVVNPPSGIGRTTLGNRPAVSDVARPTEPSQVDAAPIVGADAGTF